MSDNPKGTPIPGWVKSVLELGPVLGFFVVYLMVKDDTFTIYGTEYSGFIVVTAGFIPVILASIAALWALTGAVSPMQIVTAVLVVVFGGLTVWFNDERFVKMRPTLVYGLFAAVLFAGLWRGRSLLAMVLSDALPLSDDGWMTLTRRMAWFFVAMAASNEIVWRFFSTEFWVTFETFALPAAMALFIFVQIYMLAEEEEDEEDGQSPPKDG